MEDIKELKDKLRRYNTAKVELQREIDNIQSQIRKAEDDKINSINVDDYIGKYFKAKDGDVVSYYYIQRLYKVTNAYKYPFDVVTLEYTIFPNFKEESFEMTTEHYFDYDTGWGTEHLDKLIPIEKEEFVKNARTSLDKLINTLP